MTMHVIRFLGDECLSEHLSWHLRRKQIGVSKVVCEVCKRGFITPRPTPPTGSPGPQHLSPHLQLMHTRWGSASAMVGCHSRWRVMTLPILGIRGHGVACDDMSKSRGQLSPGYVQVPVVSTCFLPLPLSSR